MLCLGYLICAQVVHTICCVAIGLYMHAHQAICHASRAHHIIYACLLWDSECEINGCWSGGCAFFVGRWLCCSLSATVGGTFASSFSLAAACVPPSSRVAQATCCVDTKNNANTYSETHSDTSVYISSRHPRAHSRQSDSHTCVPRRVLFRVFRVCVCGMCHFVAACSAALGAVNWCDADSFACQK